MTLLDDLLATPPFKPKKTAARKASQAKPKRERRQPFRPKQFANPKTREAAERLRRSEMRLPHEEMLGRVLAVTDDMLRNGDHWWINGELPAEIRPPRLRRKNQP